jgi:hypothetical protein
VTGIFPGEFHGISWGFMGITVMKHARLSWVGIFWNFHGIWCEQSIYELDIFNICLAVWNIFFPFSWECHNLTNSYFFRGVGQPPTSILLTIINHIITMD